MDITIKFVDFWKGFTPNDNFLLNALKGRYNVTILDDKSKDEPDLLFCSAFGIEHLHYENCIKVYYTAENDIPDFNQYDYAISFFDIKFGDRHLRYPMYVAYPEYHLLKDAPMERSHALDRGFCSVVVSNGNSNDPMRELVWQRLNEYREVASGGRFRNNIGGPVADKMEFIGKYKFNLALENSRVDNYTTEKIVEPMAAHTVPIYWGNRYVDQEFNKDAFIDVSDFDSVDRAIEYIRKVDSDDELYMKILNAPKLAVDAPVDWNDRLQAFLDHIVKNGRHYICQYGYSRKMYEERKIKERLVNVRILRGFARRFLK
ncbi:MAG: glycosyltransferase [Muribaculaceae bacterium]|nr:glycosyltransferase [Muribaculaceae bacterium]